MEKNKTVLYLLPKEKPSSRLRRKNVLLRLCYVLQGLLSTMF